VLPDPKDEGIALLKKLVKKYLSTNIVIPKVRNPQICGGKNPTRYSIMQG
jgi:hypothetical protein